MALTWRVGAGRGAIWAGAAAAAGAGLAHVGLLLYIFAGRLSYPFDLEWMEGGTLCHALQLLQGRSGYAEPSADFISFLYTPGYPLLLALLSKVTGLTYTLGRAVSLLSFLLAVALVLKAGLRQAPGQGTRWLWAAAVAGLIASTFPQSGAWYDLVRADSLYLALVVTALYLLAYHPRRLSVTVLAGVLMGAAFLTKQTASVFIVFSGLIVMARNWRRLPLYVAVVGVVAGGTTLLLNRMTDGWFWRYIFEMHQGHGFFADRLWPETELTLLRAQPVVFGVIGLWLLVAVGAWSWRPRLSRIDAPRLIWLLTAAVGVFVSALGFSTQWAYHNAYIPGLFLPAAFVGVCVPDLIRRLNRRWPLAAGAALLMGALAAQLIHQLYDAKRHVPTAADRAAGRALVDRLARIEGPVMVPYHPFYAHLAGKKTGFHHMGVKDVTRAGYPFPQQILERLRQRYYAALVLDYRPTVLYGAALRTYRIETRLPRTESPRVRTGAPIRPSYVLVPKAAGHE